MDGVLSDASGRQHHLGQPRRDWTAFFAAVGEDALIAEVARLLELLDAALGVVLLTARPDTVHAQTLDWLERHALRWDLLVMRPAHDFGASSEFKRSVVRSLRAQDFDLRLALEDDRRNVDMFHSEGVPCIYLHSGYYD